MSAHFKHSLTAIGTAALVLIAGFFWVKKQFTYESPAVVFRPQDAEIVSYNSTSHILTQTTAKGTQKSYVRNPEIVVGKNGSVTVKKHSYGLEFAPFIGVGYSSNPSAYVGLDLLDAWRFDVGPAVAWSTTGLRPLLSVGYNVWSNTSIMLGYGVQKDFHIALSVKL